MDNPELSTQFKNGDDVHFDYSKESNQGAYTIQESSTASKKKKKKKKKKSRKTTDNNPQFSLSNASLNDPDADYPQSRVIKVDSNGDVIVESLEDEYPPESTFKTLSNERLQYPAQDIQLFHFNNDEERNFWESLPEEQRRDFFQIDSDMIMDRLVQKSIHGNHHSSAHHEAHGSYKCSCPYCGRNRQHIGLELENSYRDELDDIMDYVQSVRNPEDLSLGMYSLKRAIRLHGHGSLSSRGVSEESSRLSSPAFEEEQEVSEIFRETQVKSPPLSSQSEENTLNTLKSLGSNETSKGSFAWNEQDEEIPNYTRIIKRLLPSHPELQSALPTYLNPSFVKERVKQDMANGIDVVKRSEQYFLNLLAQCKGDEKSEKILQMILDYGRNGSSDMKTSSELLSNFADLILQNEGGSFVDMVDSLTEAEHRSYKVDEIDSDAEGAENHHYALRLPEEKEYGENSLHNQSESTGNNDSPSSNNVSQQRDASESDDLEDRQKRKDDMLQTMTEHSPKYSHGQPLCHDGRAYDEYEDEHESKHEFTESKQSHVQHEQNYGHEHELNDEMHDHMNAGDYEQDEDSDFETEESRDARLDEVRCFFLIQVVQVIKQKFWKAYQKKISEDRTQKFIEELEAEENAKKEKELKKMKQKEKQKEKKRLQQLAKEEEKRKKEAEDLQKAEEAKKKQEELRAEQLRRKEELRIKKEEEKLKKIEALRKKEIEQQKRQEEHRKSAAVSSNIEYAEKKETAAKEIKSGQIGKSQGSHSRTPQDASEVAAAENQKKESLSVLEQTQQMDSQVNSTPSSQSNLISAISQTTPLSSSLRFANNSTTLAPDLAVSPVQNHLLDQLYQARPRSVSGTSGVPSRSSPQLFAEGNSMVGSIYSPTKRTSLTSQQDTSYSTWNALRGSASLQTQQNPAFFSPFQGQVNGSNEWSSADPFSAVNVQSQTINLSNQNLSNSSIVGQSIPNHNIGVSPQNIPFHDGVNFPNQLPISSNSVWVPAYGPRSNSIWNTSTNSGSLWSNNNVGNGQFSRSSDIPSELILASTIEAYQVLQASNQTVFGMVPATSLFQVAKSRIGSATLGMGEFLGSLRAGGQNQFDFVYDDFGNVTHIKLVGTESLVQPLIGQASISPQQSTVPTQQQQTFQNTLQPQASLQPQGSLHPQQSHQVQQVPPPQQAFQSSDIQSEIDAPAYNLNLSGSVQGVINHLGLDQTRDEMW